MRRSDLKVRIFAVAAALAMLIGVGCERGGQTDSVESDEAAETKEPTDEESMADKMAEEHEGDSPEATEFAKMEPAQSVTSEMVTYTEADGTEIKGYYTRPEESDGSLPGIIAIHEWWGLNDNIRSVSDLLAGEGYQVLAVDLYQGEVADKREAAKKLMSQATDNKKRVQDNLKAAYKFLTEEQSAPMVASIGWCFGGGWSLQTALMLPDKLDAAVIYYGELVTDTEQLESLMMPVIGFFGSEDGAIPPSKVEEFENAMNEAGNDVTIHMYEGANHAFANPSGERYDSEAAMDAWEKTTAFLADHLTGEDTDGESDSDEVEEEQDQEQE